MRKTPGRDRRLTDGQLRECVQNGHSVKQIAADHGVSRSNVHRRLKALKLSTTAALLHPEESKRFVQRQIDAMDELIRSLYRTKLVQDAGDRWLRDAEDRECYNIGARATEVVVQYVEHGDEKRRTRRDTLSNILKRIADVVDVQDVETKTADPRELILKTAQEVRSTIGTAVGLIQTLIDARTMERFRDTVIAEIRRESPEVANRITAALKSGFFLQISEGAG